MKTVHRYVLMEMVPAFLVCLLMLTSLFMVNKIFLMLDLVLNKKAPFLDTLILYLSVVPFILSLTIPMSMMVGTLLAFGRLSSDMEITAFKSSGVHLFHLIAPVLVVGFFMTVIMLYFNDRVLPAANFAKKKIQFKILQRQADISIRERIFVDQFEGYQFYIDRQNRDGLYSDVKAFNRRSPQAPIQTTIAQTGRLVTDPTSYQVFFHLNNGIMSWDNSNYHTYNRLYFDKYIIRLKLGNLLAQGDVKKDYEEMTLSEISKNISQETDLGRLHYMQTEYQNRLALPFSCLSLIWFCAPLGLWVRSKGFMGFVLGLVMIFLYYLMYSLGLLLSRNGSVNPVWGLWWANIVLALAGCVLYYLVVAEQSAFKAVKAFTGKVNA